MTPSQTTILVVDDESAIRMSIAARLSLAGYGVLEAGTLGEARAKLDEVDLVVLDYRLPDGSGLELLEEITSDKQRAAIMLTAHASVMHAVAAMKAGAFHYACKPVDLDELLLLVERALETTRLRREVRALRIERERGENVADIVGRSPQMSQVQQLISRIATSPGSTVLVTGESGTGKDLVSRAIHAQSRRANGPFLNITCSALPAALLESELFGHERGAFTDAKQRKIGLLEHADGGTVFLDEIGEMEPGLQAKLLRFLEDKTFRRVGGNTDIRADVRFVAATNVDLREAVRRHAFREDLYYRLAVLMIRLPPLREREGDAELLAMHFVDRFSREFGRKISSISPDALHLIRTYPWPGNVRELKNAIERAVLLAQSDILRRQDFDMLAATSVEEPTFKLPAGGIDIRAVELSFVEQALKRTRGNRTRAAKLLGMNRDQIRYRIEHFGLEDQKRESTSWKASP
jgi:DNA-binding NtrC family response regulator